MKLISLGCEKDPVKPPQLSCHLLDINQTCILLECPLDLSAASLFLPVLQPPSQHTTFHPRKRKGNVLQRPSTKRICLKKEESEHDEKSIRGKETSLLFKEISGGVLANGVPWYKAAGLELVDVGLLDAVLVSNPCGMLGLPFLTKHPDFCGKVYASKATADLGRMMMEELVLMHSESHGSLQNAEQKPPWLDPSVLATLPARMKGSTLSKCFSNRANWHPLYSVQDIRDCFRHVHELRFGEEVNINGSLRASPSSSGLSLGSSNWLLSGASHPVGYVAASSLTKNHAMPLDKAALAGCHALIISDVENVEASSGSGDADLGGACKGAVEAVRRGGSVLVPVSPGGILLELLEELGGQLAAANLKHIPIHYISSAAEEMLAYCNTVPEWLCRARQEKLYAGESLFGYVDLVQEGRLRHSKALSSPELQKVWQEPCIVFAAHCSLRMGPAVHLLHRWRQNPLCLLILTERESEKDLLLAPHMPLSMQVLELRAPLRLRSEEVVSLLQSIRPQVALVPDFSQKSTEVPGTTHTIAYHHNQSIQVPALHTDFEVDMSADLALQVQPKLVKPKKLAAAPFQANFTVRDGKLALQTPSTTSDVDYQYRYGPVSITALSRALQERGMGEVLFHDPAGEGTALVVEVRLPSRAWIELGVDRSCIKANDASVRGLIADAINSVLQVL